MDPFRLCLALGPLAVYLIVLGALNLSRRSRLLSGSRDLIALSIAVAGLMIVGPIELLLPIEPWSPLRPYAWAVVLVGYGLLVSLIVLLSRPRLTIYNVSPNVLRAVLAQVIDVLDPEARWAGSNLVLPRLEVDIHVEPHSVMRCVSLVAANEEQNLLGWRRLEAELIQALRRVDRPSNPWGWAMVALGSVLLVITAGVLVSETEAVVAGYREMLRLD